MCTYCKMAIVDKQHAAMAVTDKGKAYKFDAIECLIPFLQTMPDTKFQLIEVNDYDSPGTMIPATGSSYVITKSIPSPMGAFLSAFSTKEKAMQIQQSKGGVLYNWNQLNDHLRE